MALFDSGASHRYLSRRFVEKHSVPSELHFDAEVQVLIVS